MGTASLSRRCFLHRLGGAALAAAGDAAAQAGAGSKPRVLFFSRGGGYEHAVVHRQGGQLSLGERRMVEIGRQIGVDVECEKDGRVLDGDLGRFDAFAMYWCHDPLAPNARGEPPVTPRGKERLMEAVAAGKGFLGLHCAAYAFISGKKEETQPPERRDPYVTMLGGEVCGVLPKQTCRFRIVAPEFPGFGKLKTPAVSVVDEPMGLKNFADDLHVIALHETEGLGGKAFRRPPFPCIWARRQGRGRVFYVSLAHYEETWQAEPFQHIVSSGLDWILGRVQADLTPNWRNVSPGPRREGQP